MYKVPYGMDVSVSIRRHAGTAHVVVHAPLYMRKQWELPHSYSASFTDAAILRDRDFITQMIKHYPGERHA